MQINGIKYSGLTNEEVENRIKNGEHNTISNNITKTYKEIFIYNIFTFFNIINVVLFSLLFLVGSYKNMLFMFIIVINTIAGIYQEIKAKKTLDRLKILTSNKIEVIRNGDFKKIHIDEIVIDDLMLLTIGCQIPTDCILLEGHMEVNESLLTGESDAVLKQVNDELYSGSFITSGRGICKVVNVGKDNYINTILSEAKTIKKYNSKLRDSIDYILKIVSIIIVPIGILLFLKQSFVSGIPFDKSIIATVAALVGMIPEGLVLLTTVALTVSVLRLAKQNTLVQELYCIETLARIDTLCLDKTGTLTQGTMIVEKVDRLKHVNVSEIISNINANLEDHNVTSLALIDYFKESNDYQCNYTIPFSSERKYSGVSFDKKGTYYLGAYQFLFPKGNQSLEEKCLAYTEKGFRVIVLAHSLHQVNNEELPGNLEPLAIIILSDVIRKNVKETLAYFREQGVDIKIISGDDPITVSSIAKKAGVTNYRDYIDASLLHTDEEIFRAVQEKTIFGRVSPQQKKAMVIALKKLNHTVAMTGDGVNDVLAFKESDCSIAMASGSDAAKNAANLVLLDNNFDAMPHIVNEGRRVINNISASASLFLIKTIFSSVLAIGTILLGQAYPFEAIQLSIISGCCVGIPSFLLTYESNFNRVKSDFMYKVFKQAFPYGILIAISSAIICNVGLLFKLDTSMLKTICVLITGWCYYSGLKEIYSPMTAYRRFVIYSMQVIYLLALIIGKDFLSLNDINFHGAIIIMAVAVFTQPLINFNRFLFVKSIDFVQNRIHQKEDS